MSSDINSNNSFSNQGSNITSISSVNSFDSNNDYSVNLSGRSSFDLATNDNEEQLLNDNGYNSTSGYGLIDAAAAVSQAVGQNTFADVSDLGSNNWGADLVNAPEAWAQGYTGQDVVVAVLDTGVDYTHDDLNDNIWTNSSEIADNGKDDDGNGYIDDVYGWSFADNNNNTLDNSDYGHGTHVAGTIAGENNGFGVTGIAYDSKIMPVKVMDDQGSGSYSWVSQGIYYAVNNGADVINLSLGSDYPNSTLEEAIEYASSKGVVVVMAAGNDGDSQPGYPAGYADTTGIAVGAVDQNNNMADFSNQAGTNELTYVTAPGVDVYSTVPGNNYASYSGTSMATPHVAGVVALMLSGNQSLTDTQVRQMISETAVDSTKTASSSSNDFVTQSNLVTSSFHVTQYQDSSLWAGKTSTSQDQLNDVNNVQTSSFSTSSTLNHNDMSLSSSLGSRFLSYQTITDSDVKYSTFDNSGTNSEEMLGEYWEWLDNSK
ncbi:S8 family peptidase [Mastigocladopsis repens]|uniref:S8 family peptidase n=1 Tax=Mastigocladopsis repens TaxID=221287 RepID=UPI0002E4D138|nr:S8 family peptidase [Mastigocladopsis repens]